MNSNNLKIGKVDYLILIPLMALAFYIAFIPHINYPYPLHVDEWIHFSYSEAITRAGSVIFPEPFSGQSTIGLSSNLETGFQLLWSVFQQVSGIPWLTIFKYFPGVIFMFTILSVYVMARRQGFGWEAGLFASLIPTTVGILGPAFLVPVALALPFIPLSLFIVFNFKSGWSYLVLFLFTCLLLVIHAATAVGSVIVIAPYVILSLKGDFKHSLSMAIALILPFLVPFSWIFARLEPTFMALFSQQPLPAGVDLPRIIHDYGYLPSAFCVLGAFLLALKGGRKNYGLVLGLLLMSAMLLIFYRFHYGVSIMYERGLMYAMLVMGIIAGAGLAGIRKIKLPDRFASRFKAPFVSRNIGNIMCICIIGVTLAIGIPTHRNTPYYYMINDDDYRAFAWIRDNLDSRYDKAILDPWKGAAFTAITGRHVYSFIHVGPTPQNMEAYAFLEKGATDTNFLRDNGISIVYIQEPNSNPDLVKITKDVYILK